MKDYYKLRLTDQEELDYSSKIECKWEDENNRNHLLINLSKDIVSKNMQEDGPNFESIAFCVWSILPECKITLNFDHIDWGNKFPIDYDAYGEPIKPKNKQVDEEKNLNEDNAYEDKSKNSKIQHYMRFLYRVWKMSELYEGRFLINPEKEKYVNAFSEQYKVALETCNLLYTAPNQESNIKDYEDKITENHLEKCFVYKSAQKELTDIVPEIGNITLHDQFPCGLFYASKAGEVCERTRIFNSGAFDLWGVDISNTLCIYELKTKDNTKLGIISELFFYSCLSCDFLKIGNRRYKKNYRGFAEYWKANNDEAKAKPLVKAFFLVDEFHSFIEKHIEEIIREMNRMDDKIVEFGKVKFKQEDIVKPNEKEFVGELKKLRDQLYTNSAK